MFGPDKKSDESIRVEQESAIDSVGEIEFARQQNDTDLCDASMHALFRSVAGQVNRFQSRAQRRACRWFSRCASASAGPAYVDDKALNKFVCAVRAEPPLASCWLSGCGAPEQRGSYFAALASHVPFEERNESNDGRGSFAY